MTFFPLSGYSLLGLFIAVLCASGAAWASEGSAAAEIVDLTGTAYGYLGVILFIIAYTLVPLENNLHLRKSKPVMLAAGLIWILVALAYISMGDYHTAHEALKDSLLEYAELFLFLLAAMTYINALEERNVFQTLRAFLVSRGFSLRKIFWITGLLAFFISPIADNLTTALLMGAVVMAVGGSNKRFIALSCINIVVAANAGGAFSPFGDITTLMVWQKQKAHFIEFFDLFIPSLVNWLIPALIMSFAVENKNPKVSDEVVHMKYGAKVMIGLFLMTIATAVSFHNFLHLPPAAGMMLGLGYLGFFSYHVKKYEGRTEKYDNILGTREAESIQPFLSLARKFKMDPDILQMFHIPTFVVNKDHKITHWNEAMEHMTGIKSKDIIGTANQWKPFYHKERPVMADLIVDKLPEDLVSKIYDGRQRKVPGVKDGFTATTFAPGLGEAGKWVYLTTVPILDDKGHVTGVMETVQDISEQQKAIKHFDLMEKIARAEWDTLLFFYGVILCVGGLSEFGYLAMISKFMYHDLGPTIANTLVGILSAIVDNIPVMFAVLTMNPDMHVGQWLLVSLTAGTGGSMLSIGSAAGVGLMGTARGTYTFAEHLKWTPVIALGYFLSIFVHYLLNMTIM